MTKLLPLFAVLTFVQSAHALISIQFDVTGSNTLAYELSGVVDIPVYPDNEGYILLVDIATPVQANYTNITGDARIGNTNGILSSYMGYNSLVFATDPLQLRFAQYIQDGWMASGGGEITFDTNHQLTNSMFVDGVTAIYLGAYSDPASPGPIVGYASAVPELSSFALFLGVSSIGFVASRRRR